MLWTQFSDNYDLIRDSIARVIPGFDNFDTRARQLDGFILPHPPRDERRIRTDTGRAIFTTNTLTWISVPNGRLILQTMRSHDQYNTTIYGLDDRYRGIKNAAESCSSIPKTSPDLVTPPATGRSHLRMDYSRRRNREPDRDRFSTCPMLYPPGNAAAYYPETNPSFRSTTSPPRPTPRYPKPSPSDLNPTYPWQPLMGRLTTRRIVTRLRDQHSTTRPDTLVVAEPLEMRVGGTPLAVTMRTPGHDVELAYATTRLA